MTIPRHITTRPRGALLHPAMRMTVEVPTSTTGRRAVLALRLLMFVTMRDMCGRVKSTTVKTWVGLEIKGGTRIANNRASRMTLAGTHVAGTMDGMIELLTIHRFWRRGHGNLHRRGSRPTGTRAAHSTGTRTRITVIVILSKRTNSTLKGSEIIILNNNVEIGGMTTRI